MNNEALAATFQAWIVPLYTAHRITVKAHPFGPDSPLLGTVYYATEDSPGLIALDSKLDNRTFFHTLFHELAHQLFSAAFDVEHHTTQAERDAKLASLFGGEYDAEALDGWLKGHYSAAGSATEETVMDMIADMEMSFWWPKIKRAAESQETWNEFIGALDMLVNAGVTMKQIRREI